ncbi:MAG TPA: hypothetical protein VG734_18750 [Lacunisphaera sp.]|nr:hypothetical protein [Lacunisphaera sp.]
MKNPAANDVARAPLGPLGLLAGVTVLAWLAGVLWPRWLLLLGISEYGMVFLDSHALLAAVDAVRAGADPHAANPLDPLLRPHVYSDWWLALRWLGLTRADNFLLGAAWVGAFACVAWTTTRPRTWAEAVWLGALMVSPPFLLAINRANNDLVIFVVLAGCGLAATAGAWWRLAAAAACLALATGLKYFPAAGAAAFLWARPVRRMPAALLLAMLAAGLALANVWTQIGRSRFAVGSGVHVMGAPLWWRDFGWPDDKSLLPGLLVIVTGAVALVLGGVTAGLATRGEPRERLRGALGALVVLSCFAAGTNHAYRWIFLLWPALWLWRRGTDASLSARQRWAARAGCSLAAVCLWLDGVFCVAINFLPPRDPAWVNQVQLLFRLGTQPLHWLLMILLAGWLLEGALATLLAWRADPAVHPTE